MNRILWIFVILVAAGCTLTSNLPDEIPSRDDTIIASPTGGRGDDAPTPSPTFSVVLRPTQTIAPTQTARPNINTGNNTGNNTSGNQPPPNCFPRNDWPLYTVVGGDTLGSIAARVNSTTRDLTSANCLSNPNLISPGQSLRVPRLPAPPTQPQPNAAGYVTINPFVSYSSTGYVVSPGVLLTVNWPEARRDATRVDFFQSRGGAVSAVGSDFTPSDGAVVTWTASSTSEAFLYATAYLPNGTQQTTLAPVRVVPTTPNPVDPGTVYVSPYLRVDGTRYIVASGVELTINWPNAPVTQSNRVEFYMTFAGQGNTQRIGTDSTMSDGASIRYTPQTNGVIYAIAYRHNGTTLTSRSAEVGIESQGRVQGNVVVSPYVRTDGSSYGLRTGSTVTVTWPEVPTAELSQVEFTLIGEDGGYTSLGLDTNLSDGASIQWVVTPFTRGSIYAAGPLPGQNHTFIESNKLSVFSIDIIIVEPFIGKVVVSPILREQEGMLVLQNGANVTITWPEAPTTAEVTRVEFYLTPPDSSPSLIGTDTNISDGASATYTVPSGITGSYLSARAYLADGRTSETATAVRVMVE